MLVGDIYQLEPVVREDDRRLLNPFYRSSFFFDAKIFQQFQLVSIELTKVYRQSDPVFISILDHIRTSQAQSKDLQLLNQRVGAQLDESDSKLAITLSTRRDTVDYIKTSSSSCRANQRSSVATSRASSPKAVCLPLSNYI